jgi:hypothetical protein
MPAGRRRCSLIEGGWIALLRTSNFLFATLARPWAEKGKAVDSLECLPVRRGREVPQYYYGLFILQRAGQKHSAIHSLSLIWVLRLGTRIATVPYAARAMR